MAQAPDRRRGPDQSIAARRVLVAAVVGVVAALVVGFTASWIAAPVVGWTVAAAIFLVWTWAAIWGMNAADTARHATREDPTVSVSNLIVTIASVASLAGVALLLVNAQSSTRLAAGALGAGSVVASWFTVHTLYTLKYAALYYQGPDGGISFNQKEPPAYGEFAYLGFTLGMTYQVSDTDIQSSVIRRTALRHAMLSYLLGAVVLAILINLVGGLAS